MEKVAFEYTMSKETLMEKEKLVKELLDTIFIKEWIKKYDVSSEIIERNCFKFKDYVERKKICEACNSLEMCMQPTKGNILELEYDGSVTKNVCSCHYSILRKEAFAHKVNFLLCDMSDEQLSFRFNKVDFKEESNTYKLLVNDMVNACLSNKQKGFYLCGEPGSGKTYLACCFVNEMAIKGMKCAFVNVSNYISTLKMVMYDKEAIFKQIEALKKADVVVFDDIGGESVSNWGRDEILLPILNTRMENNKITLFTSNYDFENLEKYYALNSKLVNDKVGAKRIVERMKALSDEKVLNGLNRRIKKGRN